MEGYLNNSPREQTRPAGMIFTQLSQDQAIHYLLIEALPLFQPITAIDSSLRS